MMVSATSSVVIPKRDAAIILSNYIMLANLCCFGGKYNTPKCLLLTDGNCYSDCNPQIDFNNAVEQYELCDTN